MSGDRPELLASDTDRERVVAQLREASVQGRLTLEEFVDRLGRRTPPERKRTSRRWSATSRPRRPRRPPSRGAGRSASRLPSSATSERTGRWRMPSSGFVGVVFGDADIDLRQAELDADVVVADRVRPLRERRRLRARGRGRRPERARRLRAPARVRQRVAARPGTPLAPRSHRVALRDRVTSGACRTRGRREAFAKSSRGLRKREHLKELER